MSVKSVLLLTSGGGIHSRRWARALSQRGLRVIVVSQQEFMPGSWGDAILERMPGSGVAGYLANAGRFRSLVRKHAPDVVNVHYATGYGLCALLSGVRPYVLSVWGADVYDFPAKSWIHRAALRRSLRAAGRIASTSKVMARQVERILGYEPEISITPFGVDTGVFRPGRDDADGRIVVGTVKRLAWKYGIDILLRGFALLKNDPALAGTGVSERLALEVVGTGPEESNLRRLAAELGLQPDTIFKGPVPHESVPMVLRGFDVYVAVSRLDSESFGVAVIEASSCGVPVVVSDVGGLPEVVDDDSSGIVIPREDPKMLHLALKRLVLDPALRARMGTAGSELVKSRYEWDRCVDTLLACYQEMRATV